MAFVTALLLSVLALTVMVANAQVTPGDFSGVWRADFEISHVNVLTPDGPSLICRDALTPECEAEISLTEDIFTFNESTLAIEIRDRIGITTMEESAAVHPECAKDEIYPFERVIFIPQSEIMSYDHETDRIHYINPNRPRDLNCIWARYRFGKNGPYIEVTHTEFFQGPAPDVISVGASFRCFDLPQPCFVRINESAELTLALQFSFNLTCVDGDCMDAGNGFPSASLAPNESPVDV